MPLTDIAVRKATPREKPYRLADGGGMYLEVAPSGGKYWRLKYRFAGKEKRLALGVYMLPANQPQTVAPFPAAMTDTIATSIRLPTVVRFCHRDFAVEGFFDSDRVLLDRLVAVEEIVKQ